MTTRRQNNGERQLKTNAKQIRTGNASNVPLELALQNRKMITAINRKNYNNSQSRKPKKNTNRKRNNNKNLSVGAQHLLGGPHPCVAHYASALADPEGTPAGACVPFGFPTPTQRIKNMLRGTMRLGTTGQGYVYCNMPIANNATAIQATTVTSVGTASTALDSFTNTLGFNAVKLPYTAGQLNTTNTGRVVSQVLKVRYTGTEAGRNGVVTTIEQPTTTTTRLNVANGNTILQMTSSLNERPSPTGEWHVVKYTGPSTPPQASLQPSSLWDTYLAQLVVFVNGVAGDSYEWEFFGHYEFNGQDVAGTEVSHADPGMFAKVVEAFKDITTGSPLNDTNAKGGFVNFMREAGGSVYNYIKKQGMSMALSTISGAFLPGSGPAVRMLTNG
jgi:hypothetical protein